ncbi:sugar kinase [Verrucomicrobiaceae bacterium N1E253]|uniref:Sugar kinase n=2 Tax=Oceaniferula marina TaxID=2748318 RepID=A0A851GFY9_9BACT|nr:sugar kinase [Oceaniferula marina]NWK54711.1 sugar kinase [Oceaniferula marina]
MKTRQKANTQFDSISMGEVMLRLDPGEGRIKTTRRFQAWEGGGEYNVARGLRRCFGLRTGVVTSLVRNEVGSLLEDLIFQGGVDSQLIQWREDDGIGRSARNGLNFTERGFGMRAAKGCSDRAHTAVSQLKVGDVDWDHIFGTLGSRWFHTGGIFAALSESTAELTIEACQKAQEHDVRVSYDLNYRPSLWNAIGGKAKAQEVNRAIAPYVDVMIGNEEDFTACLGFEVEGVDSENVTGLELDSFKHMIKQVVETYPNFKAVATTLRDVVTASINDWGAILWHDGEFYEATHRPALEIYDRVGGGDSFASGLIYGLMELQDPAKAVEYGAAHGALAMTTAGDTTMASLAEVEKLVGGGSARVDR